MAKLGDICIINPKTPVIDDNCTVSFVPMPRVGENGEFDASDIKMYHEVKKGFTYFQNGDILFAKITPCMENGKGAVARSLENGIGFGSTEFHVLRPKDNLATSEWIYYLLSWSAFRKEAEKNMTGSAGQKRVPKSFLENYDVALPSKEEQKNQADTLAKIDRIISLRKEEINKLDELVKSRFIELFGTIHDNKLGYEIKTLQDVCEQIKDGTHQTPTYTDDRVNGYRFLSSKDVTTGKIDWTHLKYIPEELHNELYARIAPKKGDILLAKNGTTGIAAIVDRDEIFDIYVSLALLRPIEINAVYLWAAINSVETKQQFDSSLKGIGVPNLHLGEIKKARIIVPPIEDQNAFATFVEQVDKSKYYNQKTINIVPKQI